MSSPTQGVTIDRYVLLEELTRPDAGPGVRHWRGRDMVLDREVSIRLVDQSDPRAAAFAGAARAAALVEDRRLLRILDVMDVPAFAAVPASIAVVSEWVNGRTLTEALADRQGEPFTVNDAVILVADVARAISAGLDRQVGHGRLRPSSVVITDAGEIRVRGLAVDAAIWGSLDPELDWMRADVDSLGSLLYLCLTGAWPAGPLPGIPGAPQVGGVLLPPSRLRADVPRALDELVARSCVQAARPRGMTSLPDATSFYAALGVARDYVLPIASRSRGDVGLPGGWARRLIAFGVAGALIVAAWVIGWQLVDRGPSAWQPDPKAESSSILTDVGAGPTQAASPAGEAAYPIALAQSFDPFVDANGNGRPDRRKGREGEDLVPFLTDLDPLTEWATDTYRSSDADGKGGVGVILDLGRSVPIRSVALDFGEAGSGVQVRVLDSPSLSQVEWDPQRWALLASAPPGAAQIELRAPRPVTGRFVLIWLDELPAVPGQTGRYQGTLRSATVKG